MSNGELGLLGLSHNPFRETNDEFYPGGQRKRLLDQLSHLSQWSRRSLLVTGVRGSGKTTLCNHLAQDMEPTATAAKVAAEVANSRRDVLASALEGFGRRAPEQANAEDLYTLVCERVDELQQSERLCVLLVDDAHKLESRAIESLLRLSLEHKVRLVMLAEPSVSRMVEEIGATMEIACHETQLIGFGRVDVRGYLEWRMAQAGYKGKVPFTDSQIETIAKVSSGLPGRIDELAGQELMRLGTGGTIETESAFPMTHRLLVGLLVVVFGLLYLVVSGEDEEVQVAAANEVPGRVDRSTTAPGTPVVTQMEPAPTQRPIASTAVPATPLPEAPSNAREQAPLPETPAVEAREPVRVDVRTAAAESTAQAARPAQVERAVAPEPADPEPVVAAVERTNTPPATAEPTVAPEPTPRAQPAPAATASDRARVRAQGQNQQWLLEQNPGAFTLQLFTLSSLEGVERLVAQQDDPEQFASYTLRRGGRDLYVVLYGVYPSRAAASAASVGVGGRLGVAEPWLRSLRSVQDNIRAQR